MTGTKWMTPGKIRLFVTAPLFLGIFGIISYAIIYGFDVTKIEFLGEGMEVEIQKELITGNSIFFPSGKVRTDLLKEYPQLADVIIKKKFPHTILIMPVLRKPIALLVTSKATYGIDAEAKVLGLGYVERILPEIRIDIPMVVVGSTLKDTRVESALQFLEKSASFIPISVIQISEDSLSFRATSDKTDILFTQGASIDTVMATLQTIMTGVRMKGTMPKIIDVRFSKPVIQW